MGKVSKNQKRDHELYFVEDGDEGFSPERNKAIIDETIKKYEAKRKAQMKDFQDKLGERSEAVAMYLKHVAGGKSTPVEKYFGRRNLAYLRGEKILQKVKNGMVHLGESN